MLFSVHLKATMMKVSDPIIFGHAVQAFFPTLFDEYGDTLAAVGISANDGLGSLLKACAVAARGRARWPSSGPSARASTTAPGSRWSTTATASPTCTSPAT